MSNPSTLPPIRRVVTGHDRNNVAKVIIDGPATKRQSRAPRRHLDADSGRPTRRRRTAPSGRTSRTSAPASSAPPPPENGTRLCGDRVSPPAIRGAMHRTETYRLCGGDNLRRARLNGHGRISNRAAQGRRRCWVQRATTHAWVQSAARRPRAPPSCCSTPSRSHPGHPIVRGMNGKSSYLGARRA